MNNLKQRNLFELFLKFSIKELAIIRSSDDQSFFDGLISEHKNIINDTNIYFICKKPRLRFIESSLLFNHKGLHIGFELTNKDEVKREYRTLENYRLFFGNAVEFLIHPERKSKIIVKYNIDSSVTLPVEKVFDLFDAHNQFQSFSDAEVLDYKVLYIGKSLGNKTQSNSYKRILKHEKLQRILSDIMENEPYNEVFVMMATLNAPVLMTFSDSRFFDDNTDSNFESIKNLISIDKLSKKEVVDIVEAGLIKYFQPCYNTLLKNSKVTRATKFLSKCKKYNINSASIVIDTQCMNLALYSSQQKAEFLHHAQFQFHSEINRIKLQDVLDNQNKEQN